MGHRAVPDFNGTHASATWKLSMSASLREKEFGALPVVGVL
jgi:hypothetical protein